MSSIIEELEEPIKPSSINWEQRRYELAKAAMVGILTSPIIDGVDPNPSVNELAHHSVRIADALIAELKPANVQPKIVKREIFPGDMIEIDGEKHFCKENTRIQQCIYCSLFIDGECKRPYGNCYEKYREDGKNLIFENSRKYIFE